MDTEVSERLAASILGSNGNFFMRRQEAKWPRRREVTRPAAAKEDAYGKLPEGWEVRQNLGRTYRFYVDRKTDTASWVRPVSGGDMGETLETQNASRASSLLGQEAHPPKNDAAGSSVPRRSVPDDGEGEIPWWDDRPPSKNILQMTKDNPAWHEARQNDDSVRDPKHVHCAFRWDPMCTDKPHYQPNKRPLAEPPAFDYDTMIEEEIPSTLRFKRLFPHDIAKSMRCRDITTEHTLLRTYNGWVADVEMYEGDPARKAAREELLYEVLEDVKTVEREKKAAFEGVTDFAMFEYKWLDQDGKTRKIEAWTCHKWKREVGDNKEIWDKYGHLAPPEFVPGKPRTSDDFRRSFEDYGQAREVCKPCQKRRMHIKLGYIDGLPRERYRASDLERWDREEREKREVREAEERIFAVGQGAEPQQEDTRPEHQRDSPQAPTSPHSSQVSALPKPSTRHRIMNKLKNITKRRS